MSDPIKYVSQDNLNRFAQDMNQKQKSIFGAKSVSDQLVADVDTIGDALDEAVADIAVLDARVDNIASIPAGSVSTSADAELVDIRVGADGTVYSSAGNAVRGQVGELKNDLNGYNTLPFGGASIIQGFFTGTGAQTSAANRIRVSGFVEVKAGSVLKFVAGTNVSEMLIGYFTTNGTYIRDSSWYSSNSAIEFALDYKICVVFRNSANTDITPSDYDGITTLTSTWQTAVNVINNSLDFITSPTNLIGLDADVFYPVDLPAGSTITMSTIDGSQVDKNNIYLLFYNGNREYKGQLNFWTGYSSRTINVDPTWGDIKFLAWRVKPYIPVQVELGSTATSYSAYLNSNAKNTNEDKTLKRTWNNIYSLAHRGSTTSAPENTMEAFQVAFDEGFDCIETDVRRTSDGEFILMHDESVDRTTDGTGNVNALTYAQIEALDAGSWFSDYFAGAKVPKLSEYLAFCRKTGCTPAIEIKEPLYTTDIINIAKSYGFRGNRVIYIVESLEAGQAVITVDDQATIFFTVSVASGAVNNAKQLRTGKNNVVLSAYSIIVNDLISDCIAENMDIAVWPMEHPADILNLNPAITSVISGGANPSKTIYTGIS